MANSQPGNPWPSSTLITMQSFFEHVSYGVVLLDRDLRSHFINRAFRDMWRLPITKADNGPTFAELVLHGRDTGAYAVPASQIDTYVSHRIDSMRAGNISTADLQLNGGRVIRLQCERLPCGGRMLIYTDVTDLVRDAERLKRQLTQSAPASSISVEYNDRSQLQRQAPGLAPWQVRRAEEYIEANWNRVIRIEDIAEVTNVSARSIFRTFRHSRGCSPMEFARQLRLRHAQELLMAPSPDVTVTDIAMACGFGDLGRFSKDYRAAFGESPSRALNRAKNT